ncbi:hypothetical protein AGMMS49992_02020 [Clostridia bacterium]|nr:hypothetical protein AGMMS49992_02020 [Clostridia bacterium]
MITQSCPTRRDVDLSLLTPHGGARTALEDGALNVWTTRSITSIAFNLYGDTFKASRVTLPGLYHPPFRIDMTVRLDYPALILLIGNGYVSFATPWQDNRKIEDIISPSGKPNQDGGLYNNALPFGEYTDISVTYGLHEMQICVGGEERYYSNKRPYMKKLAKDAAKDGLTIGLAVFKRAMLNIKSISVTELDAQSAVIRGAFGMAKTQPLPETSKPTFESVIAALPVEYQSEVVETDTLLRTQRPVKFMRRVNKTGKVTYVAADYGISYALHTSGACATHGFSWYIVTQSTPETWGRKVDRMEETLAEIAKTDAALAERIFYALNDCVSCYGDHCMAKTAYVFNGAKRMTCHGKVMLHMAHEDFRDVRAFFQHINTLIAGQSEG